MTFGIDISVGQKGISLKDAKDQGVEFVGIKAGGFNYTPMHVADNYTQFVDEARSVKLPIAHYWVVGKGDPAEEARFFASHLHDFDKAHDVLALDNEPLDSNSTFWKQDDALKFFTELQSRTGIDWDRLWLYSPASLARTNAPWNKITDKKIRIWWSAYGGQPTGHTPDHTPDLQGKIARWDIHQFTDRSHVAGQDVDGDFSEMSVHELFRTPYPPAPSPDSSSHPSGTDLVKNTSGSDWSFTIPDPAITGRIQRALGRRQRFNGPANGKFTVDTARAIQETIKSVGYAGQLDGIIQKNGCHGIQLYAQKYGSYSGPIDDQVAAFSWIGFALGLERP